MQECNVLGCSSVGLCLLTPSIQRHRRSRTYTARREILRSVQWPGIHDEDLVLSETLRTLEFFSRCLHHCW